MIVTSYENVTEGTITYEERMNIGERWAYPVLDFENCLIIRAGFYLMNLLDHLLITNILYHDVNRILTFLPGRSLGLMQVKDGTRFPEITGPSNTPAPNS